MKVVLKVVKIKIKNKSQLLSKAKAIKIKTTQAANRNSHKVTDLNMTITAI
jgi:hypothetical protein